MAATACAFCSSDTSRGEVAVASERMYGIGGAFHYRECPSCGSLTLEDVPNIAAYYPADYYAFTRADEIQSRRERIVRHVRSAVDRVEWTFPAFAGRTHVIALARALGVGVESSVLDVGCGNGAFLRRLARLGVRDLTGVDPYAPDPVDQPGLRLIRGDIDEVRGRFDAIFFNHSLEHVADPEAMLRRARAILKPDGVAVIRIPVAAYAWRRFRQYWVQLDAPRHLSIPTRRGMEALTARAGLRIERVVFDSTSFQFWGSRAYERGLPLRSVVHAPLTFGWFASGAANAIDSARAAILNAAGLGDQAAFICRIAKAAQP